MNSKTDNTSMNTSFLSSPMQNPSHRYKRKPRRLIKPIRRLSTIDEIDIHCTSSSDSSDPKKNVVFRRTDLGNVFGEILKFYISFIRGFFILFF